MSFKKNKHLIIRKAISKDLATFIANYFLMQKQVYDTCKQSRYFSPFETIIGEYDKPGGQIPNTYFQYGNGRGNRIKIISCIYLCKSL